MTLRTPVAALVAVLMVLGGLAVATATPASAASATMTFNGRGWGHGRGMSQHGAQGNARNGWKSERILSHYYGNTHHDLQHEASSNPVNAASVRIRLMAMDNRNRITVGIGSSSTLAVNNTDATIPNNHKSVQLRRSGSKWEIWSAPVCGGNYSRQGTSNGGQVTVRRAAGSALVRLCRPDDVVVWYPGKIRGWTDGNLTRTINVTSAEEQLRGIVPHESPASWHAEALKAQSVAARSYLLAGDGRHQIGGAKYADTCDTTVCQVYKGHHQRQPGGSKTRTTHPNTDAAIDATTGVVRLMDGSNAIARTEFHSTSGGWTAGGTFPAVRDRGDSISPLHTWTRTVSVAPLESAYGRGGRLTAIEVTKRNGLGAMGGRVLEARLRFSNGVTKKTDGHDIRRRLGLLSDWFAPTCAIEGRYIDATYELFVGRSANASETGYWCPVVRSGNRAALTHALSVSHEWAGVQIKDLYRKILDRSADSNGYNYWLQRVRNGLRVEEIATYFYGGGEYFARSGRTNSGFVDRLYRDLLGRPSDHRGRAYWVDLLNRGVLDRSAVAANFYASIESRRSRVESLYRQILGRSADPSGRNYWADQLLDLGDVALAAYLAASHEYYKRVT